MTCCVFKDGQCLECLAVKPIANAPELLALLQELLRAGNANTRAAKELAKERLAAGFLADVRAAIAKAGGK